VDASPASAQRTDPSRRGRCLGAPAHGEVTPSRPPDALALRAPWDRGGRPAHRRTRPREARAASTPIAPLPQKGALAEKHQVFVPLVLGPRLLDAVCAHPRVLRLGDAQFPLDSLEPLVALRPTVIAGICEALLNELGSALSDARTRPSLAGDSVVGIALTLIGLGGETAFFERMLELDVPAALGATEEIDKRAKPGRRRVSLPRRRRRK